MAEKNGEGKRGGSGTSHEGGGGGSTRELGGNYIAAVLMIGSMLKNATRNVRAVSPPVSLPQFAAAGLAVRSFCYVYVWYTFLSHFEVSLHVHVEANACFTQQDACCNARQVLVRTHKLLRHRKRTIRSARVIAHPPPNGLTILSCTYSTIDSRGWLLSSSFGEVQPARRNVVQGSGKDCALVGLHEHLTHGSLLSAASKPVEGSGRKPRSVVLSGGD